MTDLSTTDLVILVVCGGGTRLDSNLYFRDSGSLLYVTWVLVTDDWLSSRDSPSQEREVRV